MKLENFEGIQMRLCDYWFNYIPVNIEKPINYLEIGTLNGANLFSVADYYGKHSDSKLYCIDPWDDYEDYCEYKNIQDKHFDIFLRNLNNRSDKNKITYYKNYSHKDLIMQNACIVSYQLMGTRTEGGAGAAMRVRPAAPAVAESQNEDGF